MQAGKIVGVCLICVGSVLLALQVRWTLSRSMTAPQSGKKMQEEFKRSPYAGIFGVALIVGGIGFVFTAKRNNDPTQQTLE